jgi:transcriptional regulator with XRE-family HTH domain
MAHSVDGPGDPEPGARWAALLRTERQRAGMTQAELATRAGLDTDTIRKYEHGTRQPGQEVLVRLLDALQVPFATRQEVMTARGFHYPETRLGELSRDYYFSIPEMQAFADGFPWPMFTANELGEIAVANHAAQALWQVDLGEELAGRTRARANLFVAMAEPRIASRLVNFEELLGAFVALYKRVPTSRAMLEQPGAVFDDIVSAFSAVNPAALLVLYRLWQTVPPRDDKVRWTYPVVWREPGFADIHFIGSVTQASEALAIGFDEWIPGDPASFATMEAVIASRGGAAGAGHARPARSNLRGRGRAR